MSASREVIRMNPESPSVETDGRVLAGYLAVFDSPAEINSYEGHFVERIMPGAFSKTLQEAARNIKVMFNHGKPGAAPAQFVNMPLGKPSIIREDDTGLYMEVPLSRTSYNDDLIALINDGAIDGMSFRGGVVKDRLSAPGRPGDLPERAVTEIALREGGPVTWPAYEATTVGITRAEDFEAWADLDDEQRAEIRRIMRGATDLRTLQFPEAAPDGTSEDESRDATTREPVGPNHSTGLTPAARERVLILTGVNP